MSLAKQDIPKSLKLPPIALPAIGWSNSTGDAITPSPPLTAPDPGKDCVVGPTTLDTAAKWLEITSQSPHAIGILVLGREAPDLGIFPRALQTPIVLRCSRPGTLHFSMQTLYLIQAGAQNVLYTPPGTGSAPILNLDQRSRKVYFPLGADWQHHYTQESYKGGTTADVAAPLAEFPLFKRMPASEE